MDDPQLKSLMDTYHKMLQQEPGDEFEAEPLTEQISFTVGSTGGSSARRQQKINKAADAGVPNAAAKAKGPLLPGSMVKLANSYEEEGEEVSETVTGVTRPTEADLKRSRETLKNYRITPGRGVSRINNPDDNTKKTNEAYDIVLDFLISEGYADSIENADKIMAVMAENKIKEIVEQSAIRIRAINVVDDQRRGSHGMADDMNKTKETLRKMRPYPNGFPGVRGV